MNLFRSTTTTLIARNKLNRSALWCAFLLVPFTLVWFTPTPVVAQVTCNSFCDDNGNTAQGLSALVSLTTGHDNTAIGAFALFDNTSGSTNTANGARALALNTTGFDNTATGNQALFRNTTGTDNTADGGGALFSNTTGNGNTANGFDALEANTTGRSNTANGASALVSNTTGSFNTANGTSALVSNTTGNGNTANGLDALFRNTTGGANTANGFTALKNNTIGDNNTATGNQALFSNTTGINNTADGAGALSSNTTGSSNVGLGSGAGNSLTTGSGNVCIGVGVAGVAGESNTTRIGNVYASAVSGRAVYVNFENKIGTLSSSRRYKEQIKAMDKDSETLFALKPVTFHYKKEIDPARALSFGLIAEEVSKVDPNLITRDEKGEPETVRYEAVNAMLLNEFLKEHKAFIEEQRKVQEQEATIRQLKQDFQSRVAHQQKQIEALTAGLQKVSEQLEVSKSAPQTVLNNQ